MQRCVSLAFALAILGFPSASPAQGSSDSEEKAKSKPDEGDSEASIPDGPDALADRIAEIVDEQNAPAAGVAVVEDGKVTLADGFGLADVDDEQEATDETLFRIGSISKGFVALATLKLRERGELDLRAEVEELAPELPFANPHRSTEPVRVAHLLEHTAGFEDMGLAASVLHAPDASLVEGLKLARDEWRTRWAPGRYFAYSNPGPAMAAYVVQKQADVSFESFTQQQLFDPLGMDATVWNPDDDQLERIATGYRSDGTTEVPFQTVVVRPSGNLSLSPNDMASYVRLMVERGEVDGTRLLETSSLERMETPKTTLAAKQGLPTGYALGNTSHTWEGYRMYGHDGGLVGHTASFRYIPNEAGFLVSLNASDSTAIQKLKKLLKRYITRDLDEPEPVSTTKLDPNDAKSLTGYYELFAVRHDWALGMAQPGGVVRVTQEEGELTFASMIGTEPTELLHTGSHLFRTPDNPVPTFAFLENGQMQRAMEGGSANYRRVSAAVAWGRFGGLALSILAILSAVLFSFVWIPRRYFGSLEPRGLQARAAVAGASWLLVLWVGLLFLVNRTAGLEGLATANAGSVSAFVACLLFNVAAVATPVWTAWREYRRDDAPDGWGRWLAAWHTRATCAALLFLDVFLAYYGLLAVRTWQL